MSRGSASVGTDDDRGDYAQMRAFVLALCRFLDSHFPTSFSMGSGIAEGIQGMEANVGPRTRLKGIRMAVADVLEMSRDFTREQLTAADAALAAEGAPLLSTMRARIWRKVPRILARGKIRNEVEYYLVIERLNDVGPDALQGAERELAGELVSQFEHRAAKARKKAR